jgi:vanadium-dependent haloperoxidase-like protein
VFGAAAPTRTGVKANEYRFGAKMSTSTYEKVFVAGVGRQPSAKRPEQRSLAVPRSVVGLARHPCRCLVRLLALGTLLGALHGARAADAVTTWSSLVVGQATGDFDPFVSALMHAAMHDALNAIKPRYARWTAPAADEPPAAGAAPEAAIAAAAYEVLMGMQPEKTATIKSTFAAALASVPDGPAKEAGLALGKAIAAATLAHRAADRGVHGTRFTQSNAPGHWRVTPPETDAFRFGKYQPFSGAAALDLPVPGPPELGSPAYVAALAEVRALGSEGSKERSDVQTRAAEFFANQSSSLNFLALATRLLDARPAPRDIWDSARTMTLMSIALSDSYILYSYAKERFHFWRPITAIREGGFGVTADPGWKPLVPTPEHPEHPSAHATECMAGATVLHSVFGTDTRPVTYVANDAFFQPEREYPSFTALANDCADSRVWAGAHFRTAGEAGQKLGEEIAVHVMTNLLRPLNEGR